MGKSFDLGVCHYLLRRRGTNHFDVYFCRIGPVLFLSKDGKDVVREGKNGREVFISRQSWHFTFIDNMIKVLFLIFTLIGRVKNCVLRQGKRINRRNELLRVINEIAAFWYCTLFVEIINCLFSWKRFPHNKRRSTLLL